MGERLVRFVTHAPGLIAGLARKRTGRTLTAAACAGTGRRRGPADGVAYFVASGLGSVTG
jgi:hypothetical protein